MASHRIALIPGDGVGGEITEEAVRVLDAAADIHPLGAGVCPARPHTWCNPRSAGPCPVHPRRIQSARSGRSETRRRRVGLHAQGDSRPAAPAGVGAGVAARAGAAPGVPGAASSAMVSAISSREGRCRRMASCTAFAQVSVSKPGLDGRTANVQMTPEYCGSGNFVAPNRFRDMQIAVLPTAS